MEHGISIIIPCLNEEKTVREAIYQSLRSIYRLQILGEVIVVDNGSTDRTVALAVAAGARVVEAPLRGYGSAVDSGIQAAKYHWIVFADADLSYPFDEIPTLIQPLLEGKADIVLGSRLSGKIEPGAMPYLNRHLGTPFLSYLIRKLYGLPISDCNSGMRALDKSVYQKLMLLCPGMEYASEMLIRVGQKKFRYEEVPISFRKDKRGRSPHLHRWRDGWRHLRFILGNAPSKLLVGIPVVGSFILILISFLLSLQSYFHPNSAVRYHTAFSLIAIAVPPLLFALSTLLVKAVLHQSGQLRSRLVAQVLQSTEKSIPILFSLLFFGMVILEVVAMLFRWSAQGWGELSEVGVLIRVMIYTILGVICFSVDMGMSILRLIRYQGTK